jgi:hypothetical protein
MITAVFFNSGRAAPFETTGQEGTINPHFFNDLCSQPAGFQKTNSIILSCNEPLQKANCEKLVILNKNICRKQVSQTLSRKLQIRQFESEQIFFTERAKNTISSIRIKEILLTTSQEKDKSAIRI